MHAWYNREAMKPPTHFLNGKLVPEDALLISPRDLGFARGFAVFDFLRTYNGHRPFKLKEHIDRLFYSARTIDIPVPWDTDTVERWVHETLEANSEDVREKFIRIMLSGGRAPAMVPVGDPTIIILIDPVSEYPKTWYENGVGIITEKFTRYMPLAKTNNYIEGIRQTMRAEKAGAMEPVYYSDEQVFEGSNSNIFALIQGELLTPKNGVLSGITKATLFKILKLDIPLTEKDFTLPELVAADEVFLTASSKEIVPVTKIDGNPVGGGSVGPITKEVMRQFRSYTASSAW